MSRWTRSTEQNRTYKQFAETILDGIEVLNAMTQRIPDELAFGLNEASCEGLLNAFMTMTTERRHISYSLLSAFCADVITFLGGATGLNYPDSKRIEQRFLDYIDREERSNTQSLANIHIHSSLGEGSSSLVGQVQI